MTGQNRRKMTRRVGASARAPRAAPLLPAPLLPAPLLPAPLLPAPPVPAPPLPTPPPTPTKVRSSGHIRRAPRRVDGEPFEWFGRSRSQSRPGRGGAGGGGGVRG